jgi:hypothetical protein
MSGFGSKEIIGMFGAGSGAGEGEELLTFQPKRDTSKKQSRLRVGVVPKWAKNEEDEEEENDGLKNFAPSSSSIEYNTSEDTEQSQTQIKTPADRRLALTNNHKIAADGAPRRRRVYEAEVVMEPQDDRKPTSHELDNNSNAAAPELIRRRIAPAQVIQEPTKAQSEEEVSSSEYETDTDASSSEEEPVVELPKPVFISRAQRELKQAENERHAADQHHKEVTRKKEQQQVSRAMVAESIRRNDQLINADEGNNSDAEIPDDTDNVNLAAEREAWEMRELERLQRDINERVSDLDSQSDLQARRLMSDEQVEALQDAERVRGGENSDNDDEKYISNDSKKKSYHKGAFYMDDDSLSTSDPRRRDFSGMTTSEATFLKGVSKTNLKDAKFRTSSGKFSSQC